MKLTISSSVWHPLSLRKLARSTLLSYERSVNRNKLLLASFRHDRPERIQECQRCPLSCPHAAVVGRLLLMSLSIWMYIFLCSYVCCGVVSFFVSFSTISVSLQFFDSINLKMDIVMKTFKSLFHFFFLTNFRLLKHKKFRSTVLGMNFFSAIREGMYFLTIRSLGSVTCHR